MKKLIILVVLVLVVVSCADFEDVRELRNKGKECYYDHKGDFVGCRYM